MRLILPAILDGYQRRKDKSVSLRFVTQEKSSHEIAEIDSLTDEFGILYFRSGDGPLEDTEEIDAIDLDEYDTRKTQSQRLRAVLYCLWKQEGEPGPWTDFYKNKTQKIIEHFKSKLED